jgi:hypothetical protein
MHVYHVFKAWYWRASGAGPPAIEPEPALSKKATLQGPFVAFGSDLRNTEWNSSMWQGCCFAAPLADLEMGNERLEPAEPNGNGNRPVA